MRRALVVCVAIAAAACPARKLGPRSESLGGSAAEGGEIADVPVRGFNIHVDYIEAESRGNRSVNGELLATDADHIWVAWSGVVRYVHAAEVRLVTIELYSGKALTGGLWTGLGTLSTLSHGFLLVLSAPAWLATGISVTAQLARDNDGEALPDGIRPLWQYARYPQGLPDSMRNCPVHAGAKPKPFEEKPPAPPQL